MVLFGKVPLANSKLHFRRILHMANEYDLSTSSYVSEKFYQLSDDEWDGKVTEWMTTMDTRRAKKKWVRRFYDDKRFFNEYASPKYDETQQLFNRRQKEYQKRFNLSVDSYVGPNVVFRCSHYIDGYEPQLSIGHNVSFTENVFIDWTGRVIIDDGVMFTNGVIVESHIQDLDVYRQTNESVDTPKTIHIGKNVYIGSRAIILASCNSIGDNAVIGANSVVTKDVPANCLVAGVPAKVIKYYDK